MDIRRSVLYAALGLIVYSLWMNWDKDYPATSAVAPSTEMTQSAKSSMDGQLLPDMKAEVQTSNQPVVAAQAVDGTDSSTPAKVVHVQTDVLDLAIDLQQGDIVTAQLMDYPTSVKEKNIPFTLLQNNPGDRYIAKSSLFVVQNQAVQTLDFNYQVAESQYALAPSQQNMVVELKGQNADGLTVVKRFGFKRGSYLITVDYELANTGSTAWKGYMNTQLLRSSPKEDKSSMFHVGSYTGASYSHPGVHRYQKVSFKDMSKTNLDANVPGGWIAMQQHYFLSAWVPDDKTTNRFYTRAMDNDYTIGLVSQPIELNPSQQKVIASKLYVGPEVSSVLHAISPGLDLTVDYGWLWFISSMLFSLMSAIYSLVGNWGWSIVLVTMLIKLAFYKLSATSYKSMANMRRLQPKLAALKERYGNDKAKMSQATMEFYRQEKVNPLGGCLPILVQIPVFIALYWVLIESVELRQAPFILWINDLAAADPYHILPIIMGATMLIQQKLNPAPPDPMQAKIMMLLPVFFTALFWGFPAGLVLYWIVNNTLSILQQWYITRKYADDKPVSKVISVK
jgi:YidC/Oxa1 family membrane protein insertase